MQLNLTPCLWVLGGAFALMAVMHLLLPVLQRRATAKTSRAIHAGAKV